MADLLDDPDIGSYIKTIKQNDPGFYTSEYDRPAPLDSYFNPVSGANSNSTGPAINGLTTGNGPTQIPSGNSMGPAINGLTTGNGPTQIPSGSSISTQPAGTAATTSPAVGPSTSELRAVLSPLSPNDVYKLGNGIMSILATTNGMIFPYTPTIQFTQAVNYTDLQLVHSNSDYPAYTRTPSVTISVSGEFTVQNQREGWYAMAAIHFLRTVSKSYFGDIDKGLGKAGLPPPVLLFSAYGPYVFNRLRCILKSHSWSFDKAMDTVPVTLMNGALVRLPAMFSITTELMVVQTPNRMKTEFSFDDFASGQLMSTGRGWV